MASFSSTFLFCTCQWIIRNTIYRWIHSFFSPNRKTSLISKEPMSRIHTFLNTWVYLIMRNSSWRCVYAIYLHKHIEKLLSSSDPHPGTQVFRKFQDEINNLASTQSCNFQQNVHNIRSTASLKFEVEGTNLAPRAERLGSSKHIFTK